MESLKKSDNSVIKSPVLQDDKQLFENNNHPRKDSSKTIQPEKEEEKETDESEKQEDLFAPFTNTTILIILQKNPLYAHVRKLCLWEDIFNSSLLFVITTCSFLLLRFGNYSVLTLTSWLCFSVLFAFFFYVYGYRIRGEFLQGKESAHPFKLYLEREVEIPKEFFEPYLLTVVELVNFLLNSVRKILYCESPSKTIQCGAILYFLAIVGSFIRGETICYLVFFFVMIFPRIYQSRKSEIQNQILKIKAATTPYFAHLEKIPLLVKSKLK